MNLDKWRRRFVKENRIYIMPTVQGSLFLAGIVITIMVAATYNNNLVFVLGFLMFAVFVVSMLETHYNVKGVRLNFLSADEGFAGERLALHFELLQKRARGKRNLRVRTRSRTLPTVSTRREDIAASEPAKMVGIDVVPARRGIFKLPEIVLETSHPVGLFRAWKVFRFTGEVVAYPAPNRSAPLVPRSFEAGVEDLGLRTSPEGDFGELKEYRSGESYHQIAWKHYARTGHLYSKVHWGDEHRHYVIPWLESVTGQNVEESLSLISGWIQTAVEEGATFEMTTDKRRIDPGRGVEHARACWRELAEHGSAA